MLAEMYQVVSEMVIYSYIPTSTSPPSSWTNRGVFVVQDKTAAAGEGSAGSQLAGIAHEAESDRCERDGTGGWRR